VDVEQVSESTTCPHSLERVSKQCGYKLHFVGATVPKSSVNVRNVDTPTTECSTSTRPVSAQW